MIPGRSVLVYPPQAASRTASPSTLAAGSDVSVVIKRESIRFGYI